MPLGGLGETGGHKGYCLGAMVDLLCGVYSGTAWGLFVPPFLAGGSSEIRAQQRSGQRVGHFLGAIWIGAFEEPVMVRQCTDAWIEEPESTRAVKEGVPVMIPGEPEAFCAANGKINGTLLDKLVSDDLTLMEREYGIQFG